MKQKSIVSFSVLACTLLFAAFFAGKASASTGCFSDSNGHWAETFICWMKDNGITSGTGPGVYSPEDYVTRAQMAVFMKKLDDLAVTQDAASLTSANAYTDASQTGGVIISASSQIWLTNDSTHSVDHNYNYGELTATVAGNGSFFANIPIPTSLYNHPMYLDGAKICYDAWYGAYIDFISLVHIQGIDGVKTIYTDYTDRNGEACVKLSLPASIALSSDDYVTLSMLVHFPLASDTLRLRSSAIYLHPGSIPIISLGLPAEESVMMQPGSALP